MYTVPKLDDFSPASLDAAVKELRSALAADREALLAEAADPKLEPSQKNVRIKKFRDHWLARKSGVTSQLNEKWLKRASNELKREVGRYLNEVVPWIDKYVEETVEETLDNAEFMAGQSREALQAIDKIAAGRPRKHRLLDISLPGIRRPIGAQHPVVRTLNEVVSVFKAMGYSVSEGPEIETDYYNFEALNFPPNHPARDSQDTLFIAGQEQKPQRDRLLLRTHTSPVQIRTMEQQPPPVRVVIPGKVHRNDAPDASHSPLFHQIEGLAVDTNITFSDLKGTLDHAMKALFGSSVKTRFFPSFFPFTEPSADVSISCPFCGGKGCRTCKQSGWIELLGCGMVDPNVFEFVRDNGYDPKKVSGFAFGMGADRIAMLKYGIDDIQLLFSGDVRFLEQFA